ncbi:MAG: hypothetical protein LBQ24_02545 [Candidatus Peribacteria bacterium]|jgi:hypothetical protein|nr:hypothetical protein [Candidatus Peribacteria bacterium]
MYKYGEQLPNERLITYEEALEWIKRKKELTPEQLRAVKEFIEFQKAKGKN